MKARLKTKILIDADAPTVFKYLSHTRYHHLWNTSLQRVDPEGELREGSVYVSYSLVLGVRTRAVNEVVNFIQNKELQVQNKTGMIQYCVKYELAQRKGATSVLCTTIVSSDSRAFAFAKPILEHLVRRELNVDLNNLKQTVEARLE
ncbi:SRPBCC family protein [Aeromicrobium sp.]|nr:SRPBCC family protein [Candidatus Saccharibacteria bacterium]